MDWRAEVDALATRKFPTPATDMGPKQLVVKNRQAIDGFRHKSPPSLIQRAVDIYTSGDLTLRNFEILGSFGAAENKCAIACRILSPSKAGAVDLEDGTLAGHSADWIKIAGVPGRIQTIRRVYFGPQWATVGSQTHADMITFLGVLGDILIEKCLFDRTKGGRAAGLNNWLRFVRNKGTTMQGKGTVRVRQSVVYGDALNSALIQIANGAGYAPILDLDEVFLPVSRIGMAKVFHPSTPKSQIIWRRVYDTYTGQPIPAPQGVRTA